MEILQNKIIVYIVVSLLGLSIVKGFIDTIKDFFAEPTYTKKAVELMLKHDRLKQKNKKLELEIQVIEKDNERLKHDITADSLTIYNSSRAYRDSLRAELFK